MVELSSPSLDTDFDLIVTQDGDIKTTLEEPSPTAELEKDLAYLTADALSEFTGRPINDVTRASLKQVVRDVVTKDPRVQSIVSFTIQEIDGESYGYEIDMSIEKSSELVENIIYTV